ncbi:FCD domain-containing protein [Pseudonocardia kujensis]|uniref:FadR/GntR family transcriptional regulator n=1 Tax=Pseudonocardia kujensis TaxID=1128675 RepID=UPI001E2B9234|nr:FCD domain-containing protein [Pseudonocardia kujensis]MCE0763342.1 FCD domain-containing protein [Pseudonocardia kujensis]
MPQTRAQSLATEIERWIVERELVPGSRIATMDELREQTGLGRATISEAARLLAERGAVDVRLGRSGGLFVAQPAAVVRLRHTLLSVSRDPARITDALAVRDALEELIDVDAALHATRRDVRDLEAIVTTMREHATTRADFLQANWALHRRIAEITPNEIARSVYLSTMAQIEGLPSRPDADTADDQAYLSRRVDVHAELVAAIAAGDAVRTSRAVVEHRALTSPKTSDPASSK